MEEDEEEGERELFLKIKLFIHALQLKNTSTPILNYLDRKRLGYTTANFLLYSTNHKQKHL
jgi:hypothetical protein